MWKKADLGLIAQKYKNEVTTEISTKRFKEGLRLSQQLVEVK